MFGPVGDRPRTEQHARARRATRDGTLTARRATTTISDTSTHRGLDRDLGAADARMLYACAERSRRRTGSRSSTSARRPSCARRARRPAPSRSSRRWTSWPYALRHRSARAAPAQLRRAATRASGKPWSSKSLRECYARGAERFGWSAARSRAAARCATAAGCVGWGMATATYPAQSQRRRGAARACCPTARVARARGHAGPRHRHLHGHDAGRRRRARRAGRAACASSSATRACRRRRCRAARRRRRASRRRCRPRRGDARAS